ncbi:MAG: extracellular solute-binding protein [Lachnospiraceae bacterium]|nr:extracellular solute-binding protein [Lachnospiraceae bacterium]
MGSEHKITSILLVLALLAGVWYVGTYDGEIEYGFVSAFQKDTIYIWYTDEELTDYINSAALAFYEDYDVRVVPMLQSGLEYVQVLNEASISGNETPDLYLTGSDSLERLIMAGLASPVEDTKEVLDDFYFPQTALDAVTYKGEYYAYPFYYETAFLLYNKTYLTQIADSALREEIISGGEAGQDGGADEGMDDGEDMLMGQGVPEGYDEASWDAAVSQKMYDLIPESIEDILAIADSYNAPEQVENIFLWDVTDILYNYFFAGAYMNVGGPCGDDASMIEIYNEDTIACMNVYQELHQFFSIESKESSYGEVLQEFLDGKTIFTIATIDAIGSLEEAKSEGGFAFEYGIAALPSIDGEHAARGLSVTNVIVVNGYSEQKEMANIFARYLAYENANTLYDRTGKMQATYPIENFVTDIRDEIAVIYGNSTSLPKILEISNFWMQLELAYTRIWDGGNVNDVLRQLSEQMKTQIAGEGVVEEVIPSAGPEL